MPPFRLFLIAILTLALGLAQLSAQDLSCGAVVDGALAAIETHCADLARDSLCSAQGPVAAQFVSEDPPGNFSSAGERASLVGLSRLSTGDLDQATGDWGLALVNMGALLPRTYAGPGVLMLLAGDAAVANEIAPERVMSIGAPLNTVALYPTTRFKLPGVIPQPVGELAADELTLVDAYDSSGDWLRAVDAGVVTWVPSDKLARLKAMADLPRIGPGATFPLQSLSLATGSAYPECDHAEPIIAIQTPADISVSLTVNGVDIHIASLVTFQQLHHNALGMTVHRGEATTIFGGTVRAGESILGILAPSAERAAEVLDWSGALPASEAELARGERAQTAFNHVSRANGWDEYAIAYEPPPVIHAVGPGEGLYRIAEWYDTSVAGIIAANQLKQPLILYSGQELVIPNPGSGFAGLYVAPAAGSAATAVDADNCAGLRLASPLGGAPGGPTPFQWDGVSGATRYQVNITDHSSNALVGSFQTAGAETSLTVAIGQLGVGGEFRWGVQALSNGALICSSASSPPMPHLAS